MARREYKPDVLASHKCPKFPEKITFTTKKAARRFLAKPNHGHMTYYACDFCPYYHVATKLGRIRENTDPRKRKEVIVS